MIFVVVLYRVGGLKGRWGQRAYNTIHDITFGAEISIPLPKGKRQDR